MDLSLVLSLIFIGFCLFALYYAFSKQSQINKNFSNLMKERNATLFVAINHFCGLPIAENVLTQIFSCPNHYEFKAGNTTFKLEKSKIIDSTITTDVELQKSNVSSVGGAVGGALLFGSVGAMIGGRVKEKTSAIVNYYLIFTFSDNNEIKYIAFDCTCSYNRANKFVKEYEKTNPKTTTIDL